MTQGPFSPNFRLDSSYLVGLLEAEESGPLERRNRRVWSLIHRIKVAGDDRRVVRVLVNFRPVSFVLCLFPAR